MLHGVYCTIHCTFKLFWRTPLSIIQDGPYCHTYIKHIPTRCRIQKNHILSADFYILLTQQYQGGCEYVPRDERPSPVPPLGGAEEADGAEGCRERREGGAEEAAEEDWKKKKGSLF